MITTFIKKFRGLKTVKEAKSLANEDSADIQNFTIRNGLLQTRPGYFKFNNTALSGAITGLYDYKPRWGRFFLMPEGAQIRSETVLNANFVGAPMVGNAPLTVWFFDTTLDWDDEITGWHWWYGDGDEGTTQFPTHIYTTPGLYTVKLEVSTAYASFSKERVNYIRVLDPDDPDIDDSYGGDFDFGVGGMNHIYLVYPRVDSVTPDTVGVGYSATDIRIDGAGFVEQMVIDGGAFIGTNDPVQWKKLTNVDPSAGEVLDLHLAGILPAGLTAGVYDVVVVNPGGAADTLEDAFTVIAVTRVSVTLNSSTRGGFNSVVSPYGTPCNVLSGISTWNINEGSLYQVFTTVGGDPNVCSWARKGRNDVPFIFTVPAGRYVTKIAVRIPGGQHGTNLPEGVTFTGDVEGEVVWADAATDQLITNISKEPGETITITPSLTGNDSCQFDNAELVSANKYNWGLHYDFSGGSGWDITFVYWYYT